ncbi:MAG TPA: FtsX-like permease family protein [Steroidobacteraceae bacterium]|nr:FtsX-like permease family protein [Steroidobacteraceae bacterium]
MRVALIFLQVCVAFTLFGVLQGMKSGMDRAVSNIPANVLYVGPAVYGQPPLTMADLGRLRSIPGVTAVSFNQGMLTFYQKPTQPVYVLGIEPNDLMRTILPQEFIVRATDLEALRKTRTGILITADTGRKYGWHIGDRIPLTSSTLQRNGAATWTFDIVGMATLKNQDEAIYVFANYSYIDEARALNKGAVGHFYAVAADSKQAAAVSDAIDNAFANSASPTHTESFRESAQEQLQSLGDLNFAIRSILSAVLVALAFSITSMTMQSVRERTQEIAILKTLGYRNRTVLFLIAAETVGICILASLVGLALSWLAFPLAGKLVPGLSMPPVVMASGVLGAVLVALVGVSLPGLRAARLNIVDALAEEP